MWKRFLQRKAAGSGARAGFRSPKGSLNLRRAVFRRGCHTQPELEIDREEPKNRLLPIPLRVLERNVQLEQNPGWE